MSQANNSLILPTILESSLVFEESFVKIRRDQLQIDHHLPYHYYSLLTHPFAVAVLASTTEEDYVINEEYRHPTGHILLGCPGGYIEPGESALQAAQRELLEETGFKALSFHIIGSAFPYAGFSSQKTIYIRALGATSNHQTHLEVSEVIRPRLFKLDALTQAIKDGAEIDGTLCTALFFNQSLSKIS